MTGDSNGRDQRGGDGRDQRGGNAPPNRAGRAVPLDVDADSGPQAFMQALEVPRNAKRGLIAGVAFTLAVFVFFVVIPGTYRSPLWYIALGFVLAISTAGFVTFLLVLVRAYRLSHEL